MSLRKKTGEVWNYFEVVDELIAKCEICKTKLSYKTSTTNLKKHILRKHPTIQFTSTSKNSSTATSREREEEVDQPAAVSSVTQPSLSSQPGPSTRDPNTASASRPAPPNITNEATVSKPSCSSIRKQSSITTFCPKKINLNDQKKIDEHLMLIFTQDMLPFRIVENKGFRSFVSALNPNYELPSRHSISNTKLPAMYEKCVHAVRELVGQAKTACLTTDCWTSINNESFMGVTAHFVTDGFELKSVLLDCVQLQVRHTSSNLATELKKVIEEWGLDRKVVLVVSDNASNIKKTIRDELKLRFFGCFAHTINLIVSDALSSYVVVEVVTKIKTIVSHFKRSSNAQAKLMTYQEQSGKIPKKLKQDVVTRWNSTYYMLERFCELEEAVKTTMALLDKELPVLTQDDWQIAKELTVALKPFEEVTRTASGEQYITASMVIAMTNGLVDVCNELKHKNFCAAVALVVDQLYEGVLSRLGDNELSQTLTVATFLDPRFKTELFSSSKVVESTTNEVRNAVAMKIANSSAKSQTEEVDEEEEDLAHKSDAPSFWNFVKKAQKKAKPKGNALSKAIIEVQRYLDDDIIGIKKDPLKWWKENCYKFPFLSELVKERFCSLATSVPCERLFSKGGYVLNEQRTRLTSNKVRKILFINGNIEHVMS